MTGERVQSDLSRYAQDRFNVTYLVHGSASEARAAAELIRIDQTVEASEEALTPEIREHLLGRIEAVRPTGHGAYEIRISYPAVLFGRDAAQVLNVLFGTSSLRGAVRLLDFDLPASGFPGWAGPRVGLPGLRAQLGVPQRPLVCAVLKPIGRSSQALGELAEQFVLGGVDVVKDDQGLGDHPFCPFEERVARCAERVAQAAQRRGRPCLYAPHITGPAESIHPRARFAKEAGAGALLVAPGLVGFDAIRTLSAETALGLPILSHPALVNLQAGPATAGIAPPVLFGRLPRLAGADVSIYPSYGVGYAMERADCAAVGAACRGLWGGLKPTCPTAAGRMGLAQAPELCEFYGGEVLFVLGSAVQAHPKGVRAACEEFIQAVTTHGAWRPT